MLTILVVHVFWNPCLIQCKQWNLQYQGTYKISNKDWPHQERCQYTMDRRLQDTIRLNTILAFKVLLWSFTRWKWIICIGICTSNNFCRQLFCKTEWCRIWFTTRINPSRENKSKSESEMSSPTICPRIYECQNINGKMSTTNYIIDTLAFIMTVFIWWSSQNFDMANRLGS